MINQVNDLALATTCSIVGCIGLCLSVFIFLPQLISIIRTKNTSGTSLWTYIIYETNAIFWSVWAWGYFFNMLILPIPERVPPMLYMWEGIPAVISDTFGPILMTIILSLKIKHLVLCKKLKINEIQLADFLLAKDRKRYIVDGKENKFKKNILWILPIVLTGAIITIMAVTLSLLFRPVFKSQDNWIWVLIINFFCGATTELISWPQFIKILRYKDTSGISLGWAIFVPVSGLLYFSYDLMLAFASTGFSPNTICALVLSGLTPSFGVMILKIQTMVRAKKLQMSEVDYIVKVLQPKIKDKKEENKKVKL